MDNTYRLKHNASEKYLCLDNIGKIELTLKDDAFSSVNSLFTFKPLNEQQEFEDNDIDQTEGIEIKNGSRIYIETYFKSYLQSFADIDDETTKMFSYRDYSNHEYYT